MNTRALFLACAALTCTCALACNKSSSRYSKEEPASNTTITSGTPEKENKATPEEQPQMGQMGSDKDKMGMLEAEQGTSPEEMKRSASIRREISEDKSLSADARNVKVITSGSKVTLKGVVDNAQEKAKLDILARKAPGVTEVDDQLTIKTK
jgi:hypothetical protein